MVELLGFVTALGLGGFMRIEFLGASGTVGAAGVEVGCWLENLRDELPMLIPIPMPIPIVQRSLLTSDEAIEGLVEVEVEGLEEGAGVVEVPNPTIEDWEADRANALAIPPPIPEVVGPWLEDCVEFVEELTCGIEVVEVDLLTSLCFAGCCWPSEPLLLDEVGGLDWLAFNMLSESFLSSFLGDEEEAEEEVVGCLSCEEWSLVEVDENRLRDWDSDWRFDWGGWMESWDVDEGSPIPIQLFFAESIPNSPNLFCCETWWEVDFEFE